MKTIFTILLSCVVALNLSAQNEPDFAWGNLLGNDNVGSGIYAITTDNSGNIYLLGFTAGNSINLGNGIVLTKASGETILPYLVKFDNNGECLWARKMPFGGGIDKRRSMVVDDEGNIYVVGLAWSGSHFPFPTVPPTTIDGYAFPLIEMTHSGSEGSNARYLAVVKLDAMGQFVWANPIPIQLIEYDDVHSKNWFRDGHISIRFNPQGNLMVAGLYQSDLAFYSENDTLSFPFTDTTGARMYLATYDKDGVILGAETFPTGIPDAYIYNELTLNMDAQGNLYRYIHRTRTFTKYDPEMNIIAEHELSAYTTVNTPPEAESSSSIDDFAIDKLGNIYLICTFRATNATNNNSRVTFHIEGFDIPKYGDTGNPQHRGDGVLVKLNGETFSGEWYAQYLIPESQLFKKVVTDELDNIYVLGTNYGPALLLKYMPDGQQIWATEIVNGYSATNQPNTSVLPDELFISGDGGNILCIGNVNNRIQLGEETIVFPTGTIKSFLIQYGICDTEKPTIAATPSTSFCAGDSVQLSANGSTGNYIWNTGETVAELYTDNPIIYNVIAQQDSVCYGKSNSLTLKKMPKPDYAQIAVSDSIVCAGNEVTLTASSTEAISWEEDIENGVPFILSDTHEFYVTVTDSNGCTNTTSQLITAFELPNIEITEENNVLTASENADGTTYQWIDCQNNNLLISGATAQIFEPTQNGEYAVVVTSQNGCSDTSSCHIISTLSIQNNPMLDKQITLYPNPTSNEVNIQTELDASEVYILDLQGKKLQKTNSKDVNLSKLSSGIYLIKVKLKNNEIWTSKVIKN